MPDDLGALQRLWAANVEPAKPEDSTWSPAPEVVPMVVGLNKHGDVVAVRFLRFRTADRPIAQPNTARESRPRRRRAAVANGASRRGPPADDADLDPPQSRPSLTRAERVYLKAEVDRLARQGIADQQVVDRALFRAVEAWGSAEVVA
jgi:hypothetical protein